MNKQFLLYGIWTEEIEEKQNNTKKDKQPHPGESEKMPMTEEATPSDVDEYTSWQTQSIWDRCVCARQISCTQYETGRFTRLN